MLPYAEPPKTIPSNRPTISELVRDPSGASSFTVTFQPGQELPTHRNVSRVLIAALSGSGTISVDGGEPMALKAGGTVQVSANAPHALWAGENGLQIQVHLVADCCSAC